METAIVSKLVLPLLVILLAGLAAGIICKRLGVSVLVGYLTVGAVLGQGGATLMRSQSPEIEHLAEAGALLLLFSIGIEFSLEGIVAARPLFLRRRCLQMMLVMAPVIVARCSPTLPWGPAVLIGAAAALSSTVLVYKALEEFGQTDTAHGRRAIAILLFQDVALVPLVLLIPLLTNVARDRRPPSGSPGGKDRVVGRPSWRPAGHGGALRAVAGRPCVARSWSCSLRVAVLGGAGLGAYGIGLPPALGAFAAGLTLNGNRLTAQIDALVFPTAKRSPPCSSSAWARSCGWDTLAASAGCAWADYSAFCC